MEWERDVQRRRYGGLGDITMAGYNYINVGIGGFSMEGFINVGIGGFINVGIGGFINVRWGFINVGIGGFINVRIGGFINVGGDL